MTTPVAVVMPCFNYGRYVGAALQSVAAQTQPAVDILVVDDGSTDDSAAVIERFAADHPHLPVRLTRQPNRGVVKTLNEAVADTTAPYVMFVSADDRARPELIEQLAAALDGDPRAGYAYPKMALFGDEQGTYLSYPFSPGRLIFDHNYIPGAAMVRRTAFLEVGGLRELPAHEDWDMWLGFLAAGWRGVFVPEVLYEWRRHAAARNHQDTSTKLQLRRAIVFARPRLLLRYLPAAVPFTWSAIWRRLRLRIGPPPPYDRTASACWIEREVSAGRR